MRVKAKTKVSFRGQTLSLLMALILATALSLTSCGQANRGVEGTGLDQDLTPPPSGGGGGPSEPTPPSGGFTPAYEFNFGVTGRSIDGNYGPAPEYEIPSLPTDSILKVKITSGPADRISRFIPGYGFVAPYGCVRYTITVNGRSVQTRTLSVEGYTNTSQCSGAPTSQTIDFSDRIGFDGNTTITVSRTMYDNCMPQAPGHYGCPLKPSFDTHVVTGDLAVQVNGTAAP